MKIEWLREAGTHAMGRGTYLEMADHWPTSTDDYAATVQEVTAEAAGPMQVGSRARETRRVTGGPVSFGWELTTYDPPWSWSFRGTDGPVRPFGTMRFSPANGGTRTRVDFEIGFRGRGAGTILALLARRDARRQVPRELAQLRERLEQPHP